MNPFKQLLQHRRARPPVGTWIMSASPLVAEAVGCAGFDWGVVDMEHTPLDLMNVVHLLQALAGTPMVPVLRVPWNDSVIVKRVLDAGAQTVMFPFIQSADEARAAVSATRYPPTGDRGMAGMSRGSRFGTALDYLRTANDRMAVVVQLETPQAVGRLEEIAAVDGVDAVFLGPADLSAAMGHVGQLAHPAVMALMADAARRCNAIGMPVGTLGGSAEQAVYYRSVGFDYLAVSSDLGLLMGAAQAALGAVRSQGLPLAQPPAASAY